MHPAFPFCYIPAKKEHLSAETKLENTGQSTEFTGQPVFFNNLNLV